MKASMCLLLGIITLSGTSAQQIFQKKGQNYNAKVTIQREVINPENLSPVPIKTSPRVWAQGDRITKQEVIQNLARALLARKKTPSEKREDKRKYNAEMRQKYNEAQVRKMQEKRIRKLQKEYQNGVPGSQRRP